VPHDISLTYETVQKINNPVLEGITPRHLSDRARLSAALRLITGLGLSSLIGVIGWKRGSLSRSGLGGAMLTGTVTMAAGGYTHAAMLVGFFVSSTLLPKVLRASDTDRFDAVAAKGGQRDLWQVLANGGVSTLLTVVPTSPGSQLGYIGALAAVNGDTWATEIGKTSPQLPRHILSGRLLEPGMSGGVSIRGTLGSVAGGGFVSMTSVVGQLVSQRRAINPARALTTGLVAGAVGSLVDSILGATVQERRWCPTCNAYTERTIHPCGTQTDHAGGIPGVSNDLVNLGCSLTGAAIGLLISRYWRDGS
jgi:uncharacterized protein (TIGR00297 family)